MDIHKKNQPKIEHHPVFSGCNGERGVIHKTMSITITISILIIIVTIWEIYFERNNLQ